MLRVDTLLDASESFATERIGTHEYPIPPYATYLEGVRICIDPGHGGDAHRRGYKRGPTGVREAEVNLRVALYLRDCLEAVGAEVILTRSDDTSSSLAERAEIANREGADIFVSCHHNAISKPEVNRTSVWYHADVDYRASSLDLARYLCQGLMQELALPQITGDPLKSDQLMYESGFGILRSANVTAALCESSFFTHPEEEQRLRQPEYNLREAYGLFIGLARYAYAGLPRVTLVGPADGGVSPGITTALTFQLDDGLRSRGAWGSDQQMILTSSLRVSLDDEPLVFDFSSGDYMLTANLPDDLMPGGHRVEVQFVNKFKNSVLNPYAWIDVEGPVANIEDYEIGFDALEDPWLEHSLVDIDRSLSRELGIPVEQRACGILDLNRGRLAMIRPDAIFYGASVPKIAILLTYFETHPEAAVSLSPEISQELGLMIKQSDNALAAKYSEQVGLETIRDVLTSPRYAFYDKRHGGGLWMGKHYSKDSRRLLDPVGEHSHAATVRQCLRYYLMLEQGRLVSPQASQVMRDIFASPDIEHLDTYFVKGLHDRAATILRKSGTWEDWRHDTAIIEHDGQRYILVGLTEHPHGEAYLEGLAAKVAELMAPSRQP
jgi:N-acetylmuramoyl-L-alanine amidase